MLERFFEDPRTLFRLRSYATGPHVDGFAEFLAGQGYRRWTVRGYLCAAARLGQWMEAGGLALGGLDEDVLSRFTGHLPRCACLRRNRGGYGGASAGTRLFLDHLRRSGAVPPPPPLPVKEPPYLLQGFLAWIERHRNVTPSTLAVYTPQVMGLIAALGEESACYDAECLRAFIFERAARHGRSRAKTVVTASRMFVRYLIVEGRCAPDLDAAIPTVAEWKLSSMPLHLEDADIERLIAACPPETAAGARDRAILLLLARLGLRAGEVTGLRLDDIDWRSGTLRIAGKNRRRVRLPLPQDAGDAVLYYLDSRGDFAGEELFVSLRAPIRGISSAAVTDIVARSIERAGIAAPSHGAHMLRHSAATSMLRHGTPLGLIGAVLRHRSPQTTLLYAKVDVTLLHSVAQPWPAGEVTPC